MKIHEYQAKELFRKYGIPVPKGAVAVDVEAACRVGAEVGTYPLVVKAQIHAGGRGKGGGIKVARSADELRDAASKIIGMNLVTHQTGPGGKKVLRVLVEEASEVEREIYVGLTLDRETARVTFIACAEGGVEIEEIAAKTPEKILKEPVHPSVGFMPSTGRKLAFAMKLSGKQVSDAVKTFAGMYAIFMEKDASLVEINPFVVTKQGNLLALDAKVNFDDSGLFRHPDVEALRDPNEEDAREIEAAKSGLSYISLDGNIGCLVNGAGLAMSTMDIIKLHGGEPANFLDVGGGADVKSVTQAFKIILTDPKVKAILVNIFGGIMKCDVIAAGVTQAVKDVGLKVPLVVRLEGTNVEIGRKILSESGLNIIPAETMGDAADKVVKAAGLSK